MNDTGKQTLNRRWFLWPPSQRLLWCHSLRSAHSGCSVNSSNQPFSSPSMTHGCQKTVRPLPSAELSWARLKLGTVQSNMHDGERGDSRRTRTYPAGDREHGHQLYRPNTPVSHSPGDCSCIAAEVDGVSPLSGHGLAAAATSTELLVRRHSGSLCKTLLACAHYRTASRLTFSEQKNCSP